MSVDSDRQLLDLTQKDVVQRGYMTEPGICRFLEIEIVKSRYKNSAGLFKDAHKFVFECVTGEQKGQIATKTVGSESSKNHSRFELLQQMGLNIHQVGDDIDYQFLLAQNYEVVVGVKPQTKEQNDDGGFTILSIKPVDKEKADD